MILQNTPVNGRPPRWRVGPTFGGYAARPGDATLLRQRVAALTDQFKRLQIDQQQYHDQLAQLGLGPQWVEALEATAAAAITPKTKAFALPVTAK